MADALNLQPGEIEVFRAGKYPQGDWPVEKVQAVVERYDAENEHKAFIGVDPGYQHGGKNEGRAYGFFESLRMEGSSLIAKLAKRVPKAVRDAFDAGEVLGWSSELLPEYQFQDGTVGPYFKGIKLLGTVPPQIKGLKAAIEFKDVDLGPVQAFDMSAAPYAPSKLADVLKADEVRRELSDIQWAFSRETEKVMCANDLSAAEKRAELNRLAQELASLTEGEVEQYEEEQPVADKPKQTDTPEPNKPAAASTETQEFAELKSQLAALKTQNDELKARNEKSDALIEKIGRENLRGKLSAFSEKATQDGKLSKGDSEAGVTAFMEAIEPVFFEVEKEGKTEKVSALSWFQDHVSRRVAAVPTGKKSAEATTGAPATGRRLPPTANQEATQESQDFNERVEAYAAEHEISYTKAFKIVAAEDAKSA